MTRIRKTSELNPGDVVKSVGLNEKRPNHGIGVVSNKICASGCGFLILFKEGWEYAQCTDSIVHYTIATFVE